MTAFFDLTPPSSNCDPCGSIGTNVTLPQGTCYNPCPHAHPLDGGSAWSSYISAANSAAWVGKLPEWNGSEFIPVSSGGGGTVTSVAASISGALSVSGSPITTSGTLAFSWTGTSSQYVLGDGTLATIPSLTGYVPYTGATGDVHLGTNDLNAKGLKVTGINGNGHLTMRWQSTDPTSSVNHTTFFANSVGDLKYKIDNQFYTTFSTSANTANRVYTFPDRDLTIDNITTSTTSNGTGFIKSNGANITFDNSTYLTTAITSLNGLTAATQTFANDTNVTITSSVSTHTIGWSGELSGTRGGTGVNNGARTITIAGNLTTTGAFNTTFAQQITGTFTLPPVAGTIAASATALTSGRVPFVTTSGMLTDSSNLTWDDTNKRLFGANDITVGKSTSYNISFVGTTLTISSANNFQINNGLTANGINFFSTNFNFMQSTRTFINNNVNTAGAGALGGSLTTRQSADFSFTSGEATYTAGGGTTITAATGSWNVSGASKSIGVGDRVSLSNASSTYATVTAVSTVTAFTVNTSIGAAGTLTLNVKPANFRVFGNANVLQFIVNDLGYVGIGVTAPTAWIHLAAGTTTIAPFKLTTGTNLTTAEVGAFEYNNTFFLTNSDATRRDIVLAPNATKITAAAPYANDGYIIMNIRGTDFKIMTTA